MKIQCFPVKMSKEEALKIAAGHKNPMVKLMAGKKKINLRLMWLENRYYIYEMTYQDNALTKALAGLFRNKPLIDRQKIRVIVDATTATASYTEDPIHTEPREVNELDIQESYYDDQRLEDCGAILCKRMVRRRVGRHFSIRTVSMQKVYRPYYIAIYGDMIEGTRARYIPIAADGNEVNTTI